MNSIRHFRIHLAGAGIGALLLASVTVACSSDKAAATAPDVRFVIDFQAADPSATANASAANAAGGPGVVVALGRIVIPSPCYTLSPDVRLSGQALDLTVIAQPTGASCTAVITSQGYSLRVGALASGTYHVRLTHDVQGPSPARQLMLEKDVHVD